jgi:hypothetical protein
MYHPDTHTIGQVVDTIYPPDNHLERFLQVLRLMDGSHRQFRLVELHLADDPAVGQFWTEARFARVVRA